MAVNLMKKQRDIFKIKVRFKNLIPPVLPVRIQRRQRVEFFESQQKQKDITEERRKAALQYIRKTE